MNASWNCVIIISVQNYRLLWFISIKPILKEISDLTFSFNFFHNIWEIQRNIFFQVLLLLKATTNSVRAGIFIILWLQ